MSINITTDSGNRTVELSYTAPIAKVDAVLDNAAQELHARGQGPNDEGGEAIAFGDLTNPQKLAMIDVYVRQVLVNMSNAGHTRAGVETARATAAAENAANTFD